MSCEQPDPPHHFRQPRTTGRARSLRKDSTFPERLLWSMLRGGKLGGLTFRRQHPVGAYVVDFYCDSARLAVELDGMSHVGTGQKDDARTAAIASNGVRVIRFTHDEVIADVVLVAETIARAAELRM